MQLPIKTDFNKVSNIWNTILHMNMKYFGQNSQTSILSQHDEMWHLQKFQKYIVLMKDVVNWNPFWILERVKRIFETLRLIFSLKLDFIFRENIICLNPSLWLSVSGSGSVLSAWISRRISSNFRKWWSRWMNLII